MTKRERNKLIYARYEEGYTQEEIGRLYNLSQSSISAILLRKKRNIPEHTKETRGVKSKLTAKQLEALSQILKTQSATIVDHIYWNKWSVQALIKKEFQVDYHENYIWEIMKKIGFSSQLPAKKDYRQSAEKVSIFKEEKISQIKKSKARK